MPPLPPELRAELLAVLRAWLRDEDPWRHLPGQLELSAGIGAAYAGRRILVTGGGGFIGAALARSLASLGATVTALDKDESGLLRLAAATNGSCTPRLALADCRIPARLEALLASFRPEMVFHCAAHKHLPLLESQPEEAWLNNCGAFETLGRALERVLGPRGTELLVLLSTDKAVKPASQLGASKQAAERLLQGAGSGWAARIACVRLVNVLASSGSAVEIFWRALRHGRPLEVTHPDMERYFLTLAQTVQALLHAGAAARPGDLFVPRLESPVRIADLAEAMRTIAMGLGLPPPAGPPIRITAPRRGEKLREQLLDAEEWARAAPASGLPPLWRVPAAANQHAEAPPTGPACAGLSANK